MVERSTVKGGWKLFVVALLVVAVAVAVERFDIVPSSGVASFVGDDSVAIECQNGCSPGGRMVASITPTPEPVNPDIVCQSGHACGG